MTKRRGDTKPCKEMKPAGGKERERKPSETAPAETPSPVAVEPAPPFTVFVRSKEAPRESARAFRRAMPREALVEALHDRSFPADAEPILFWSDPRLCCVDVDYHGPWDHRPRVDQLELWIQQVRPTPIAAHVSHGRGVKLYYQATAELTARELAAVAAWNWLRARPQASIELKLDARHPGYTRPNPDGSGEAQTCGALTVFAGDADIRGVASFAGGGRWEDIDDDAIDEWLDENGFDRGRRYSHGRCLIRPTPGDDKGDCVIVLDRGIYCHSCAAKGFTFDGGEGAPGFVAYGRLIQPDERDPGPLRQMIRRRCPWSHARYALPHLTPTAAPPAVLRELYTAALKWQHVYLPGLKPGDAKYEWVTGQITRATTNPFPIRTADGVWCHPDDPGKPLSNRGLEQQLRGHPVLHYLTTDGKGKVKPGTDQERYGRLLGDGDTARDGVPGLRCVGAFDLFRQVGRQTRPELEPEPPRDIPFVVPVDPPIVYVPPVDRNRTPGGADRPYEPELAGYFPGLDLNYLKLLIGGTAYSRLPSGGQEPIRVAVEGQSGSGKTATVDLAAAALGIPGPFSLRNFKDRNHVSRAVKLAGATGRAVIFDEVAKKGSGSEELMDMVLSTKPGEVFHQMYQGANEVGQLPLIVYADTRLPAAFRSQIQIARRCVFVPLGAGANGTTTEKVDWQTTSNGPIAEFRHLKLGPGGTAPPDPRYNWTRADLLNRVVSDVVDLTRGADGFSGFCTFAEFAAKLGFTTLDQATDGIDHDGPFVELFLTACRVETDSVSTRWQGRGWRVFRTNVSGNPMLKALEECYGGRAPASEADTQLLTGRQWGQMLGIPGLECDFDIRGQQVAVRFRAGSAKRLETRFNRDTIPVVMPDEHPLHGRWPDPARKRTVGGDRMSGRPCPDIVPPLSRHQS